MSARPTNVGKWHQADVPVRSANISIWPEADAPDRRFTDGSFDIFRGPMTRIA